MAMSAHWMQKQKKGCATWWLIVLVLVHMAIPLSLSQAQKKKKCEEIKFWWEIFIGFLLNWFDPP